MAEERSRGGGTEHAEDVNRAASAQGREVEPTSDAVCLLALGGWDDV